MTIEEAKYLRKRYDNKPNDILERDIRVYKMYIEDCTKAIGNWRENIKLLETILEERTS